MTGTVRPEGKAIARERPIGMLYLAKPEMADGFYIVHKGEFSITCYTCTT